MQRNSFVHCWPTLLLRKVPRFPGGCLLMAATYPTMSGMNHPADRFIRHAKGTGHLSQRLPLLDPKDIGTIDPEGYLLITDRIKDVVKSGGEWISSPAIEDIISQYPGVSEVAVIGIPVEKWGERPLALIVLQ